MKNRFNFSSRQLDLISVLALLFLTLLFFWRVPIQGRVLLPLDVLHTYEPWRSEMPGALGLRVWNSWLTDPVRQYYPLQSVIQSSWQHGVVPFWNPHSSAGMSALAAGFHRALYPITVFLLLMMPVGQAMTWGTILHAFLGSFFSSSDVFCGYSIYELSAHLDIAIMSTMW